MSRDTKIGSMLSMVEQMLFERIIVMRKDSI